MSDIGRVINSSPRSSPGSTGTIETAALARVHSKVVLRVVLVQVIRGTIDACAQALRKISEQPELMLRGTSSNSLRVTTFCCHPGKRSFYGKQLSALHRDGREPQSYPDALPERLKCPAR